MYRLGERTENRKTSYKGTQHSTQESGKWVKSPRLWLEKLGQGGDMEQSTLFLERFQPAHHLLYPQDWKLVPDHAPEWHKLY